MCNGVLLLLVYVTPCGVRVIVSCQINGCNTDKVGIKKDGVGGNMSMAGMAGMTGRAYTPY
jgi:hypothetical protein